MNKTAQKIILDITNLRVQGASQVKKAAIRALAVTAMGSAAKTPDALRQELQAVGLGLMKSRLTEPNLRNVVWTVWQITLQEKSLAELKKAVLQACRKFETEGKEIRKKIVAFAEALIPDNAVVFTHCHSHTVEAALVAAKKKIRKVYCTETRPLFQGRITATNLSKAGLKVVQMVDSAAPVFVPEADVFLTGADAIDAKGNVINKIGTSTISHLALENRIPHVVLTSASTFDPLTCWGWKEPIEQRSWKEVWKEKPKALEIWNPAFDVTPSNHVEKIVSQFSALKPEAFVEKMKTVFEVDKNKPFFLEMIRQLEK